METTLVIMAAGIGSRFGGGIKQLTPVGPKGEIIMDYSIYDALEAGFDNVAFIIRRDLEADFREIIGKRIEKICPCSYAFQETSNLPGGFKNPEGRTKPWGTGHALLSCKGIVDTPAVVINADDYYGKDPYIKMHDYIVRKMKFRGDKFDLAMPGFLLKNTLSDNGAVTRGLCETDDDGYLTRIVETKNIFKAPDGSAYVQSDNEDKRPLDRETPCSMNMWAFGPEFIDILENRFIQFLSAGNATEMKAEFLLPTIVGDMLAENSATVRVLPTDARWFGVTYREDTEGVIAAFKKLTDDGVYKAGLFN